MMDKKPHIKPYLYAMLAGFGAISLSIIFFFLIYRFQGFGNAVSTLTGILMPFIYGSVIAYLLKPVCNWIEAFLHKLFPERMHRFANMLAVALTILFGLLLIYALIIVAVNMLFSLLFGKLFHFHLEEIILASNANIGGPTTAAAMAISKGWNQLIGPVMLVGVLGYVLGNYFGILVGTLLAGF